MIDFVGCHYLGWIYLDQLEKPDKAIKYFLKSIEKNPGWDKPYSKIGESFMKKSMIKEALYYLQKGYELFDDKPDLLNNYGLALYNSNRTKDAQVVLEHCISIDKDNYKAYNNLGNVYRRLMKFDQALEFYKKSAELSKGQHITAYINIASHYLNQKDLFECIDCIEKAIELNTNDTISVLRFWGLYQLVVHANVKKTIVWYENKEFQDGIALIKDIYEVNNENIVLNWYLGLHYQKLGDTTVAIKYFK